ITERWRESTSSYFRTFLRISKLRASTCVCALWMPRETSLDSSGRTSGKAAVEQPPQVVGHRQVEPGLARVALTPRPAAQLVVDPSGLVALRAEHVQPAQLDHLVVLGGAGRLVLRQGVRPGGLVLLGVLRRVKAPPRELLDGHELRVAAEHDVGATAGHVGRDRHGTLAARLGDDRCLASVLLGVQHLVRDTKAPEHLGEPLALLHADGCLLYTSPSPRDGLLSRMPSSA